MSVALKPPIVPESISLDLRRSDRIVRSAEGGSFQREVREGQARWIADVTWPPLHGDDRRALDAWLAMVSRGDAWALIDGPFKGAGSFEGIDNELVNGDFTDDVSSWSGQFSTRIEHSSGMLKSITETANAADAHQIIQLVGAGVYVVRATVVAGSMDRARIIVKRLSDGSNILSPSVLTNIDVKTLTYVLNPSTTEDYDIKLRGEVFTADTYLYWDSVSVSRVYRVDGDGQNGNRLNIKNVQDQTGLAKAGDFVEVMTEHAAGENIERSEFKRLLTDVDGNTGNVHTLHFEPALRNAPPDNASVIFHRPRFKAVLTNENRQTRYTQPEYVQVTRRFEEDILA